MINIIKKLLARILGFFKKRKKIVQNVVPRFPGLRVKVFLGNLIKTTSGGRHGWFESNIGVIRKPLLSKFRKT